MPSSGFFRPLQIVIFYLGLGKYSKDIFPAIVIKSQTLPYLYTISTLLVLLYQSYSFIHSSIFPSTNPSIYPPIHISIHLLSKYLLPSSIPGLRRSPGGGSGNPLQGSCLENPTDRGAWQATVHGVTKCRLRLKPLSTRACIHTHTHTHTHSEPSSTII